LRIDSVVWVAGGDTLPGRAILGALRRRGFTAVANFTEGEPDLLDEAATEAFLRRVAPGHVFLAAGRSGGIGENSARPASLMLHNLRVTLSVVRGALACGARRLLHVGSSCGYPRDCAQPMAPASLWTGPLEPTSGPYAVARLSGAVLCAACRREYGSDFFSVIPPSLYGPGDDFSAETGHVVPALLRKMDEAKRAGEPFVTLWGTGRPRRELLFADDFGDGALFLMERYGGEGPVNVGGGEAVSVAELAGKVSRVVGYGGELRFDASKPDGAPVKVLDASEVAALGWRPSTTLDSGLAAAYRAYLAEREGEGPGGGKGGGGGTTGPVREEEA
jgi:GDP-L-fucose synthase